MREIQLTQDKVALLDDEDFEEIAAFKWHAERHHHTFYAQRTVRRLDGGRTKEYLHRVILARKLGRALLPGEQVDHEDGDGLNNLRCNLRPATQSQNNRNCRHRVSNPSSQYLGVSWHKDHKKWHTQIKIPGKKLHLGYHATEFDAALAREAYISLHPELQAKSNFPS
jgi:hypothetical protein